MNPAWIKRAEERIHRMEKILAALSEQLAQVLAKLSELEAKRGPGRPPKVTE